MSSHSGCRDIPDSLKTASDRVEWAAYDIPDGTHCYFHKNQNTHHDNPGRDRKRNVNLFHVYRQGNTGYIRYHRSLNYIGMRVFVVAAWIGALVGISTAAIDLGTGFTELALPVHHPLDKVTTTLEAGCTTNGGNWDVIKAVQIANHNPMLCPGPDVEFPGDACTTTCCAAGSNASTGGHFCTGTYCAVGVSGPYGGAKSMGTKSAAYANSGCPPRVLGTLGTCAGPVCDSMGLTNQSTDTLDANAYTACCAEGLGYACVGVECATGCNGDKCGGACVMAQCASNCTGYQCGSQCEGVECGKKCIGDSCAEGCWGANCATDCTGFGCGSACIGSSCSSKCTGYECGIGCIGVECAAECDGFNCGNGCTGDYCAANCSTASGNATVLLPDAPCGVQSNGLRSSSRCVGHGCGGYCNGDWCAEFASDPTAVLEFTTPPATPTEAILCWNEWLASQMGFTHASVAGEDVLLGTPHNNSMCTITGIDGTGNEAQLLAAVEGPGHQCTGHECAKNSSGSFPAVACSGERCGADAAGLFAAAACVGPWCGQGASGEMAASFCYGPDCAKSASGDWAGAYCIGNRCALNATGNHSGWCCVGRDCSLESTTHTCSNPTNGGTPGNTDIYSTVCRRAIDTESVAWQNWSLACAGKTNESNTAFTAGLGGCTVACNAFTSRLLRFYMFRQRGRNYGDLRTEESLRVQHSLAFGSEFSVDGPTTNDDDDGLGAGAIAGIVIGSVAGLVLLGVGVTHYMSTQGKKATGAYMTVGAMMGGMPD